MFENLFLTLFFNSRNFRIRPKLYIAKLYSTSNASVSENHSSLNHLISYKLPEKDRKIIGPIGEETKFKAPIMDFNQNNFALFDSINSNQSIHANIPLCPQLNELDANIFDHLSNLLNEMSMQKSYEMPSKLKSNVVKKCDYYKHRYRNRFTHLLWVRHRKMKKHQRIKWRKKNLARIKRKNLEKNIRNEKIFRAELLAQIQEAENFDPQAYVKNILYTIDNVPKAETPQQKYERYMNLIRKNRTQTNLTMPKFED